MKYPYPVTLSRLFVKVIPSLCICLRIDEGGCTEHVSTIFHRNDTPGPRAYGPKLISFHIAVAADGKGPFKKFNDSQKRKSVVIFVRPPTPPPPTPPLKGKRANIENPINWGGEIWCL